MSKVWTLWLCGSLAAFTVFETYALRTGNETLSAFVRKISAEWPPIVFLLGMIVGGLAVHFWWTSKT